MNDALRSVANPGARISAAAFSTDGQWAFTGGLDGRCSVWDVVAGETIQVFAPELGETVRLFFSESGCVQNQHSR
jgi:WD40 repeat protein